MFRASVWYQYIPVMLTYAMLQLINIVLACSIICCHLSLSMVTLLQQITTNSLTIFTASSNHLSLGVIAFIFPGLHKHTLWRSTTCHLLHMPNPLYSVNSYNTKKSNIHKFHSVLYFVYTQRMSEFWLFHYCMSRLVL